MTTIDPKRAWTFIGVCSVIGIVIAGTKSPPRTIPNSGFQQPPPQPATAVIPAYQPAPKQQNANDDAARRAAEQQAADETARREAAAQRVRYLERYLNGGLTRNSGNQSIAIVVATDSGQLDHTVSSALANHLRSSAVTISTSFFKPEFVVDGLFTQLFGGSMTAVNNLELAKSLDALLLARLTVTFSKDASLENVTSAHMQLEINMVPISVAAPAGAWTFQANGAGFTEAAARGMAEERLIKQIGNDTKLSLGHN